MEPLLGLSWLGVDWLDLPGEVASVVERRGLNERTKSAIVTLESGQRLFVKANEVEDRHEAARYRALEGSSVPTPRLLHAAVRPPVEVIVLECLERIGIDTGSSAEVGVLLRLVARLNAARPDSDLFAPGAGTPGLDAEILAAMRSLPVEADRWYAAYLEAGAAVDAMATALCHGELYFQQVGWVARDGAAASLVLFDLETLAYRPRFADIASILYPLAEATGRAQEELLEVYLEELRKLTGVVVGVGAAFAELRLFRWVDACWGLPWLLRKHAAGADGVSLEAGLRCMREDLAALGG